MSIQTRPMSNDEAFDVWSTDLCKAAINHRHAAWTLGDLMLEGDRKFDDARVTTAMEATGMTFETLQNYKSIAKAFPVGRRRLNLGITLHGDMRAMDAPIQDGLLDLVEKHEISRADLRERIKALKSGDLDALKFKWRPKNAVREAPETHAGVSDEDKPGFDSTGAGEGMAGDRHDDLRLKPDDLSDANQLILDALAKSEKALATQNISHAVHERLSSDRLRAIGTSYLDLAVRVDAAKENAFKKSRGLLTPPTSPSAGTGGDKDRHLHSIAQGEAT